MSRNLQFFYDLGSTYSYLASTQIEALAKRHSLMLEWKPFLIGGVFKATGNHAPATVAAKAPYLMKDVSRWARLYRIDLRMPSRFPLNTLLPMRVLVAAPAEQVPELTHKLMRAYWVEDQNISSPEVLQALVGSELLALCDTDEVKSKLRVNTEQAVAQGAFGAPTMYIDGEMFFGNDRLDLLEAWLRGELS
jgi:2-hydroxychromene-2-carboxylate isomerase